MENLAKKSQEIYKVYPVEEPEKIEDKVAKTLENIYYDAKKENLKYLEDTKVEAGGE
jgi:hypothetical protein